MESIKWFTEIDWSYDIDKYANQTKLMILDKRKYIKLSLDDTYIRSYIEQLIREDIPYELRCIFKQSMYDDMIDQVVYKLKASKYYQIPLKI